MKNPGDDVALSDGHGFMVTDSPYKEHLKVAKDVKEVQVCFLTLLNLLLTIHCRLERATTTTRLTALIWFEAISPPRGLERGHALGTGALFHIVWWTSNWEKGEHSDEQHSTPLTPS